MLDLGGWDPGYRSERGRSGFAVQAGLGDIVAVAYASLGRMGGDHAMPGIVEQKVSQEVIRLLPGLGSCGIDELTAFAERPRTRPC